MGTFESGQESLEEKSKRIVGAILDYMNSFRGFNKEYAGIDAEILAEMQGDLRRIVTAVLTDATITDKPGVITERLLFNLSDRRGIRQGFFDPMGRGEEYDNLVVQVNMVVSSKL